MEQFEFNFISLDIRRWDLENERLTLKIVYVLEDQENQSNLDLSLVPVQDMVEECINKLRKEGEQKISAAHPEQTEFTVIIYNESFLRQKLHNFFKKIISELNKPKQKKGSSRGIATTHMELYNENQDISFLSPQLQFFVMLNWARRHYEKEEYLPAINPLRKLIKLRPDYVLAYKWLARSLKKVRRYEEAMRYYELYARVDNSLDSQLDLAKSYRKGKLFDKSEAIYKDILQNHPGEREAKIGLAQIQYARNEKDFMPILEELFEQDPEWTKKWLLEEFNFRIYSENITLLTPIQAAQYLGFTKVNELTKMAFRNEIPSHFNPSKARLNFYREEIDRWAEVMNRFQLLPNEIKLYPEKLDRFVLPLVEEEEESIENKESTTTEATYAVVTDPVSPRVAQILKQIREARAKREAMAQKNQRGKKKNESKKKTTPSPEVEKEITTVEDDGSMESPNIQPAIPQASEDVQPESNNKNKIGRKKKSTEQGPAGIDLPTEEEFLFENNN